jgi:uncharacterized protein YtpQ (UPF0354 family)
MSLFSKLFGKGSTPPSDDFTTFANACRDALGRSQPGCDPTLQLAATPAQTRLAWTRADGWEASQFLGNYWSEHRSGQPLDDVLARLVNSAQGFPGEARAEDEARRHILPVIKTSEWLDVSLSQLKAAGRDLDDAADTPFVRRMLAGDLLLVYVEDHQDTMSYVGSAELQRMALDEPGLFDLALDNLERDLLPQLDVAGGDGRYAARLDRNYDASMILLFERWRDRMALAGDPVIAIGARDELLICGSQDQEAVEGLADMAREIADAAAYPLSRRLFTWRDGELAEF